MTQAQLIAAVTAAVLKAQGTSKGRKAAKQPKAKFDAQAAIDRAVKKAGFKKPGIANENVLTYGKWEAKGFRVIKGQKALKIGTLRLFHEEQVEPITPVAA